MKKNKKIIKCPTCSLKFESQIKVSYYNKEIYLDGKPEFKNLLKDIIVCPHCGFVGGFSDFSVADYSDLSIYSTASIADYSSIYNKLINESQTHLKKIDWVFQFIWYLEFHNMNEDAFLLRRKIIDLLEEEIGIKPDINLVIPYIDSLRQLGDFLDANTTIESCCELISNKNDVYNGVINIINYEKKLVELKDSSAHFVSEAMKNEIE